MGLGRKSNTKLARKILAIFGFAVCFPLLAGVGCRLGKGLREEKIIIKATLARAFPLLPVFRLFWGQARNKRD